MTITMKRPKKPVQGRYSIPMPKGIDLTESLFAIALREGVTPSVVSRWRREAGVPSGDRGRPTLPVPPGIDLNDTLVAIASKAGVSLATARRWRREHQ